MAHIQLFDSSSVAFVALAWLASFSFFSHPPLSDRCVQVLRVVD
jgi:hypothetical protein